MDWRWRNADGFTMFELLAVIAIMGILAGLATLGVARFRDNASASAFCGDVDQVRVATSAYIARHGPPIGEHLTSDQRIDLLVQERLLVNKLSDTSLGRINLASTGKVTVDGGQDPVTVCSAG